MQFINCYSEETKRLFQNKTRRSWFTGWECCGWFHVIEEEKVGNLVSTGSDFCRWKPRPVRTIGRNRNQCWRGFQLAFSSFITWNLASSPNHAQITTKSPKRHKKDSEAVSERCYCFSVQIQDIHNYFPYILLMFTISLGYLWWNQGVTTQMKVLNEPILIVLIVTYPFLTYDYHSV